MNYDVFISYKSQYVDIVKAIAHTLEDEKIRCWYAPRDLDLNSAGKNYDDVIVETISNCKIVVVVLCNEALTSEWVQMEINQAQKKKKFIIPYVVSELSVDNGLRMRLENKHWIDAYPNPERKFSTLLGNIKILLNNQELESGSKTPRFEERSDDFTYDFDYDEGIVLYEAKEYNDAALAFLSSAERGNPKAKDKLCKMFYDLGKSISLIDDNIWDSVDYLAKDGHCFANFIMHTKYYEENDNNLISFEYLKKAIRNNTIGLAFLRLGIHYCWGLGIKQNHILAMHYYEKALSMGCYEACRFIGQEYENGNDKITPSAEKALQYYKIGAEHNDSGSLEKIARGYIYGNFGKPDYMKTEEICKRMIEMNEWMGATLLGDMFNYKNYLDYNEQDRNRAIYWYKEAAKHDIANAFGSLADFYRVDGENEEAYKWAKLGYARKNAWSTFILGFLYENDEKYDKAWECYLNRYNWNGVGSEDLARLVVEKDYRPDGFKIEDLVHMLEVVARNSSEDSLKYLITLHSTDLYGLKNEVKILEYKKLGAALNYPEQMYEYGLTFFDADENKSSFNSFKGIDWIEKAATKDYVPAIIKLLTLFKEDKFANSESLQKWQKHFIEHKLYTSNTENYVLNDLLYLDDESEAYKEFMLFAINCTRYTLEERAKTTNKLLVVHFSGKQVLSDDELERCMALFNSHKKEPGLLSLYKEAISYIYPEFNIGNHDAEYWKDEHNYRLAYALCRANKNEDNMSEQDRILTRLYKPFIDDISYKECLNKSPETITGISEYWEKHFDNIGYSYSHVCMDYNGITPINLYDFKTEQIIPFFPTHLAHNIKKNAFDVMLSLITSDDSRLDKLNISLSDEDILNIAEAENNEKLQLLLISYVELNIEADAIIVNNKKFFDAYKNRDYKLLAGMLEDRRLKIVECGIQTELPEFTEEIVEKLLKGYKDRQSSDNGNSDEEFDRLLDEFIGQLDTTSEE